MASEPKSLSSTHLAAVSFRTVLNVPSASYCCYQSKYRIRASKKIHICQYPLLLPSFLPFFFLFLFLIRGSWQLRWRRPRPHCKDVLQSGADNISLQKDAAACEPPDSVSSSTGLKQRVRKRTSGALWALCGPGLLLHSPPLFAVPKLLIRD